MGNFVHVLFDRNHEIQKLGGFVRKIFGLVRKTRRFRDTIFKDKKKHGGFVSNIFFGFEVS